jgi:hypothetical protein
MQHLLKEADRIVLVVSTSSASLEIREKIIVHDAR